MSLCLQFLTTKASEIRESTNRAMVPEFHRLEKLNEQEIEEIEIQFQLQEINIRNEYTSKEHKYIQSKKSELEERNDNYYKDLIRKTRSQISEVELEGRRAKENANYESEREIEQIESHLTNRNDKERKKGQDNIAAVQNDIKRRVDEDLKKHSQEMTGIKKDFDQKVVVICVLDHISVILFSKLIHNCNRLRS